MGRRKEIVIKAGDKPYREIVTHGSKRIYRYKVRNLFAKKPILGYERLEIEWLEIIRAKIVAERHIQGISQMTLASMVSTTQSEISQFETGNTNPTVEFINRLITALKINIQISF